jgi:hypothetical protein
MISLKSYCGPLSKILDLTPDALYERQRALVRSGYLTGALAGKGPGSGIRATPVNVAKLIMSALATDGLSDIDDKTRKLAAVRPADGKCPFTSEVRFHNALEKILSDPEMASLTCGIEVRRSDATVMIGFKDRDGHIQLSNWGKKRDTGMGLSITAKLPGWSTEIIAADLRYIAVGQLPINHKPFKGD